MKLTKRVFNDGDDNGKVKSAEQKLKSFFMFCMKNERIRYWKCRKILQIYEELTFFTDFQVLILHFLTSTSLSPSLKTPIR